MRDGQQVVVGCGRGQWLRLGLGLGCATEQSCTSPPLAWLTVQTSKPSLLPRSMRDWRRPSRVERAVITAVCAKVGARVRARGRARARVRLALWGLGLEFGLGSESGVEERGGAACAKTHAPRLLPSGRDILSS